MVQRIHTFNTHHPVVNGMRDGQMGPVLENVFLDSLRYGILLVSFSLERYCGQAVSIIEVRIDYAKEFVFV